MQTPQEQQRGGRREDFFSYGGMHEPDELISSSGISFQLWRLNQHFWLICLLFPVLWLVQTPLPPSRRLLVATFLLVFAISYTWLMWPHPADRGARKPLRSQTSLILFAVLIALTLLLSLFSSLAFLWLLIGLSAIAGVTLPMRSAFVAVMLFTFLPLGISVGATGSIAHSDWPQFIALMLLIRGIGVDMIGVARLSCALRELHTARVALAHLAVIEERERLSRDLHDLLGHTLSLITLKSQLAGRLIEKEPTQAAHEMHEVERVARQSLREVREAVSGYRQPQLASELDAARQLLSAAGIAYSIEGTALSLPPETSTALAWTVREGVTNVIRHSRAQHCSIRVQRLHTAVRVEVINDGDPRERAGGTADRVGLGLPSLTERVTVLGGRIKVDSTTPSGNAGFHLWVELPIQSHEVSAETMQEESS